MLRRHLRTSWCTRPAGIILLTMLRLMRDRGEVKVVNDQIGSPTSTQSLAELLGLALHQDGGDFSLVR